MLHRFYIVAGVICVMCMCYLLLNPMEKEIFFLTRNVARWLFPKLDRRDRHRKLELIAGVVLAVFLTAIIIAFAVNRLGQR